MLSSPAGRSPCHYRCTSSPHQGAPPGAWRSAQEGREGPPRGGTPLWAGHVPEQLQLRPPSLLPALPTSHQLLARRLPAALPPAPCPPLLPAPGTCGTPWVRPPLCWQPPPPNPSSSLSTGFSSTPWPTDDWEGGQHSAGSPRKSAGGEEEKEPGSLLVMPGVALHERSISLQTAFDGIEMCPDAGLGSEAISQGKGNKDL